jgi:hypothetical protein
MKHWGPPFLHDSLIGKRLMKMGMERKKTLRSYYNWFLFRYLGMTIALAGSLAGQVLSFDIQDFSKAAGLELAGNAAIAGTRLRLTRAVVSQAGAGWIREKQSVRNGFETSFQFQLTGQGGLGRGADGFAFVIQNSGPDALAGRGSAGGFAVGDGKANPRTMGIPFSIAVFFDTFQNNENHDPSDNYISIVTSGRPKQLHWPPPRLAFTKHLRFNLKDRAVHEVHIVYKPPVLSVSVDNSERPELFSVIDSSIVVDREGSAWVGFTASTGAGFENHEILNWKFASGPRTDVNSGFVSSSISFLMASCLPDRSLCTPEKSTVDARDGVFHIVLPANGEWGASIPNPHRKAVEVKSAQGTVCWDLQGRGAEGCNGPEGNGQTAGSGFLMPEEKAGALIVMSKSGRTYFSVNDRKGAFGENEGYFEFEVALK